VQKILLHACCAPCACYVVEKLSSDFDVHLYYYNPNISIPSEYEKRKEELYRFAQQKRIPLIEEAPDKKAWALAVRDYALCGERSARCWQCYRFRLASAFRSAASLGYDLVGTALSISPHKDAMRINEAGADLSRQFGLRFLSEDFKKKDGFKKSLELSAHYGFYRQDYCGCIYSKLERDRDSSWSGRVRDFKEKNRV
jgi:predicted adenine nucleotide alpha hydrolase (AANH) superfamily ATPase